MVLPCALDVLLALGAVACGSSEAPSPTAPSANPLPTPAPPPPTSPVPPPAPAPPPPPPPPVDARTPGLEAADFAGPITKPFLRSTNAYLTDEAFEKKWQASLASAVLFVRAYPGAYHADLAKVPEKRIPGTEGVCFGDAHPDNFGFLSISGTTKYVYNDLDDSGYCSPAADTARWLAVVRLSYPSQADAALSQYVDASFDPSRAVPIAASLVPDLVDVADKALDKATSRGLLKLESDVVAPTAAERAELTRVVGAEARTSSFTVRDAAVRLCDEGGSGGLRRYWVLVDRPGTTRTILELKESVTPGADLGRHTQTLTPSNRLAVLTQALWGSTPADDYFYVTAFGARFLVRDRLPRKSVDLAALSAAEQEGVLRAQASYMASVHGASWRGSGRPRDEVRAWLDKSGAALAARWQSAHTTLKGP